MGEYVWDDHKTHTNCWCLCIWILSYSNLITVKLLLSSTSVLSYVTFTGVSDNKPEFGLLFCCQGHTLPWGHDSVTSPESAIAKEKHMRHVCQQLITRWEHWPLFPWHLYKQSSTMMKRKRKLHYQDGMLGNILVWVLRSLIMQITTAAHSKAVWEYI